MIDVFDVKILLFEQRNLSTHLPLTQAPGEDTKFTKKKIKILVSFVDVIFFDSGLPGLGMDSSHGSFFYG